MYNRKMTTEGETSSNLHWQNTRQDLQANGVTSMGSPMGSSVQSHQLSSFDVDEINSVGGASWRIGMPWFRNGNLPSPMGIPAASNSSMNDEHNITTRYYGGLLKPGLEQVAQPGSNRNRSTKLENFDAISQRMANEDDSLADFHESEWTPPDSAYGAACPVCGWIPKHFRRMIEFSLIAGMFLGFVYLVVTTSIHLDRKHESWKKNSTSVSDYHGNGGQVALDDDVYVESGNKDDYVLDDLVDDAAVVDDYNNDDAYKSNDDNYSAATNDDNGDDNGDDCGGYYGGRRRMKLLR